MCSAFTPDCGYDKSTLILIADLYCFNKKCSGKHCVHKKTFQSLCRSEYHSPQCASVCQMRYILFEDQTIFFLLSLGQGFYIFEDTPKSIQAAIGDVYCPGKYWSNKEKCESLDGYVISVRSIYSCGNCGSWLFVHKVLFTLQEHVKTTKHTKHAFSSLKKMNFLPDKQLLNNVLFHSTQNRKIELFVDNKVQETIGDAYCPTRRNEKCLYFSTKKSFSLYDCRKSQACCHLLNIAFKNQKPTNMLFHGDGTHFFARKTSRNCEKEKSITFLKNFLRQSHSSTPEPEPKRQNSLHLWHNRVDSSLVDTVNQIVISIFNSYTFNLQ